MQCYQECFYKKFLSTMKQLDLLIFSFIFINQAIEFNNTLVFCWITWSYWNSDLFFMKKLDNILVVRFWFTNTHMLYLLIASWLHSYRYLSICENRINYPNKTMNLRLLSYAYRNSEESICSAGHNMFSWYINRRIIWGTCKN